MDYAALEMNSADVDMKSVLGKVWARRYRIMFVTLVLSVLTYALLLFVTRTYESSASLLVEPRNNVFLRAANDAGNRGGGISDSVLMSSQVQLIQSSQTLLEVVRSENLAEIPEFNGTRPSPLDPLFALLGRKSDPLNLEQKVLARLKSKVTVIQQRDSRVISILVRTEDAALSARIANALANAHVNRLAELSLTDTADATKWLESEIEKLRIRVVDAEGAAAQYLIENDLFAGTNATSLIDQQLSSIAVQITTAQERGSTARSRSNLINGLLSSGQPVDGLGDVQNSVVVQRLSEEKARLQGQRAQLLATLLPQHPQVRSISAQISEIDEQIAIEGRRVANAFEAEAQIEEALTVSLREELARLKLSASSATTSSVRLQELQREAKALRDLLETYLARYRDASARTDTGAALPDVRVISLAMPALQPASPKSTLILIAVILVSVAVQVGTVLFSELSQPVQPKRLEDGAKGGVVDLEGEDFGSPEMPQEPVFSSEIDGGDDTLPADEPVEPGDPVEPVVAGELAPGAKMDTSARVEAALSRNDNLADGEAAPKYAPYGLELEELAASLTSGRETTVILAALDRGADCGSVGEFLLEKAMEQKLSVAIVDAASGRISEQVGITDLSAGDVDFGEVVFTSSDGAVTEVFWGNQPDIEAASDKPATLIEALADICEVVVVFAERVEAGSSMPVFAGLEATLVLVAGKQPGRQEMGSISRDAKALGFARNVITVAPRREAEVA